MTLTQQQPSSNGQSPPRSAVSRFGTEPETVFADATGEDGQPLYPEAVDYGTPPGRGRVSPPTFSDDHQAARASEGKGAATKPPPVVFNRITSSELATGDFALEYLIPGVLVAGQPCLVAAPKKCLKTSMIIDMAVALSVGGCFLGKMRVARSARVAVMSGESGIGTLQETAMRIAKTAGYSLEELNIIWSTDLPKFASADHRDALEAFITDDEIEVLFIDPAYMTMPGADAGNLFTQGELLHTVNEVCLRCGVTLVLAHHTKRHTSRGIHDAPELEDIAWAGFQEFARQWLLLNRRTRYEEGSGKHHLWLSIGGSAGHSALWAVDVSEGVYSTPGGRFWDVTLARAGEARKKTKEEAKAKKAAELAEKAAANLETDTKAIVRVMRRMEDHGDTERAIRDRSGVPASRSQVAFIELLDAGHIVNVPIEDGFVKGNGQKYPGYRLAKEDEKRDA